MILKRHRLMIIHHHTKFGKVQRFRRYRANMIGHTDRTTNGKSESNKSARSATSNTGSACAQNQPADNTLLTYTGKQYRDNDMGAKTTSDVSF